MRGSADDLVARYFAAVANEGIYPNLQSLKFYLRYLFDAVPLHGRSVLEIGGGAGWVSLYARCSGASRVVCLEPSLAGSISGFAVTFGRLAEGIGVDRIRLEPVTIQEFNAGGERFDVILMHNSINHLNEDACVGLLREPSARRQYRDIFDKIGGLAADGGILIAADCSRYNFFATLGLKNPVAPNIEWDKHQSPRTWARLLRESGFDRPRIRWTSFNRLGRLGRLLLGNSVAAYFLTSHFLLTMTRAPRGVIGA